MEKSNENSKSQKRKKSKEKVKGKVKEKVKGKVKGRVKSPGSQSKPLSGKLDWVGLATGRGPVNCQYSILIEASVKKNAPGAENNFCMIENYVLF